MLRLSICRSFVLAGLIALLPLALSCGGPVDDVSVGDQSTQNNADSKKPDPNQDTNDKPDDTSKPEPKDGDGPGEDDNEDPGDDDDDKTKEEPGEEPKFDIGGMPDYEPNDIGCDIDFLFVVDNSNSMADIQEALAASVPKFIETMTGEIKDLESYHIGVISTDDGVFNGHEDAQNCATMGGLTVQTQDFSKRPSLAVCIPYANGKHFMTNPDDLSDKFKCAAELGANGSGYERPMDALRASYSKELTKKGACNEGFFREKAILVVVIITDEEDDPAPMEKSSGGGTAITGSKGNPEDWYRSLLALKNNEPEYLVVLSLVGKPEPNNCTITHQPGSSVDNGQGPKSAEIGARLIEFTEKFGKRGKVGDVCADNFDPFFEEALSVLALACDDLPG